MMKDSQELFFNHNANLWVQKIKRAIVAASWMVPNELCPLILKFWHSPPTFTTLLV